MGKGKGDMYVLPKMVGGDIELGNSITGVNGEGEPQNEPNVEKKGPVTTYRYTGRGGGYDGGYDGGYGYGSGGTTYNSAGGDAARKLLGQINGVNHSNFSGGSSYSTGPNTVYRGGTAIGGSGNSGSYGAMDFGRKFLAGNGGCAYIDMSHLEMCLPECISAWDHVAAWHSLLRIAREAQVRVQAELAEGKKINVYANNSDGLGQSYGSHMNFGITDECYDVILKKKLHYMLFVASHFASSIVYTGAGKVGSENGAPDVNFQLAQRADFFETMMAQQTTHNRPLVNTRDESLAGAGMSRFHVIFFDSTLNHVASLLKVGATQIILAMIEQGYATTDLILDEPLRAVHEWSHDLTLKATARTIGGKDWTAVDMQMALHEMAAKFVDNGGCEADNYAIVPRAKEIIEIWGDTLQKLKDYNLDKLAPRLDWVLKYMLIDKSLGKRGLAWDSPEAKHLDHNYSSLDPEEGLYFTMENAGVIEKVVETERVNELIIRPPEDTRAWFRATVLSRFPEAVTAVDWDEMTVITDDGKYEIDLGNPFHFTKEKCEEAMKSVGTVEELVLQFPFEKKKVYTSQWSPHSRGSHQGSHQSHFSGPGDSYDYEEYWGGYGGEAGEFSGGGTYGDFADIDNDVPVDKEYLPDNAVDTVCNECKHVEEMEFDYCMKCMGDNVTHQPAKNVWGVCLKCGFTEDGAEVCGKCGSDDLAYVRKDDGIARVVEPSTLSLCLSCGSEDPKWIERCECGKATIAHLGPPPEPVTATKQTRKRKGRGKSQGRKSKNKGGPGNGRTGKKAQQGKGRGGSRSSKGRRGTRRGA